MPTCDKISSHKRLIAGATIGFALSMYAGYKYTKNNNGGLVNLQTTYESNGSTVPTYPSAPDSTPQDPTSSLPMLEPINGAYMTVGYNVIEGNPASIDEKTGIDPGFRKGQIFNYELQDDANYSGYFQPRGYYVAPLNTCETEAQETLFAGMASYASFLYTKAGFWLGACGFGFGSSTTTRTYQSKFYEYMQVLISAQKTCSVYEMKMQPYGFPPPSPLFLRGLSTLPEDYNESYYMAFFQEMGTHFQYRTTYGAALYMNAFYDASEFASVYAYSYYHKAGIDLGFFDLTKTKADAELDVNSEHKSASDYQKILIGMSPEGLTTAEWQSDIQTQPQPIQYELVPIQDLFRTNWLEPHTDKNLTAIYENMKIALSGYCSWIQTQDPSAVAYCGQPPPDMTAGPGPWFGGNDMINLDGDWMSWLTPANQSHSNWQIGYQNNYGIVSFCLITPSGDTECGPSNDDTDSYVTLTVNGPINYLTCWMEDGGQGINNLKMGWMEDGEQQYTSWAFDSYLGTQYTMSLDDGAFLSLRAMNQSGHGVVQMQVYNIFVPEVGETYVGES